MFGYRFLLFHIYVLQSTVCGKDINDELRAPKPKRSQKDLKRM